jgi:hypothetical protein
MGLSLTFKEEQMIWEPREPGMPEEETEMAIMSELKKEQDLEEEAYQKWFKDLSQALSVHEDVVGLGSVKLIGNCAKGGLERMSVIGDCQTCIESCGKEQD